MHSSIGRVDEKVEADHVHIGIGAIEVAVRRALVPRRQPVALRCPMGQPDAS